MRSTVLIVLALAALVACSPTTQPKTILGGKIRLDNKEVRYVLRSLGKGRAKRQVWADDDPPQFTSDLSSGFETQSSIEIVEEEGSSLSPIGIAALVIMAFKILLSIAAGTTIAVTTAE